MIVTCEVIDIILIIHVWYPIKVCLAKAYYLFGKPTNTSREGLPRYVRETTCPAATIDPADLILSS
jgi:hypothetical protein